MNFKGIEICCPECKGELGVVSPGITELICQVCERRYPVIVGIPDLRVFPDPYIGVEADREKGLKVAARLDELSFAELVAYYYSNTSVVPQQHARLYTRGLLAAAARSRAALDAWEKTSNSSGVRSGEVFLDLGCGTAPLTVAAAPRYVKVVGVDIAFRWLVVARKRLLEAGVDAPLICACAEALPFPDEQFDVIAAESVLEHVKDQKRALAESYRCAKSRAKLYLSTPNRYSLGPDPQVGIPAGGYLPDLLIAAIVRRQGGIPPLRRLLSAGELREIIQEAGFEKPVITLPDFTAEQRDQFRPAIRLVIDLYHQLKRLPGSRHLLFWIGPLYYAVAQARK